MKIPVLQGQVGLQTTSPCPCSITAPQGSCRHGKCKTKCIVLYTQTLGVYTLDTETPFSISSNSILGIEGTETKNYFLSEYRSHEGLYAFADVKICTGSASGWLRSSTGYWTTTPGHLSCQRLSWHSALVAFRTHHGYDVWHCPMATNTHVLLGKREMAVAG